MRCCRDGSAKKLAVSPQLLRCRGEQHHFLRTAHVREPHLDLLALAARALESFGAGGRTNLLAHVLVDVAQDFVGRGCSALMSGHAECCRT